MSVQFEYFYGSQAEQFSFYRIPKVLFTDEAFMDISVEAKVLYSFMLDRMSLSVKNCWFDDDNRVYIIYTIDDILIDFGCARQKALKLLDELEKGIGLIERKRQGLGRPNIIYVKNFIHNPKEKRYENQNTESMNIENQEVLNSDLQKYENQTSANMKIELQEVPKSYANNTYNNNTNYNDIEKSYTERNDTEITSYPINRVNGNTSPSSAGKGIDTMRWIEKRQTYKEYYENNYVLTSEVFDIDWSKTRSLDYFNKASEINNILNRISRYLGKRYDEDVKFVSKDGLSFGDLKDEAAGIMQNDIESYKSFVIQNGITSDRDKLLKQFRYVLNTNNDQAVRSRGEYAIMLDGISIYDPSITKVVFIPALDSENVFYMNRTKIGIDYLTENASKANLAGDEAENNAHYYEYLISQFGNVTNSEDWILNAADKRCEEIISKVNDFCERAVAVNDEYISSVSYEGVEISSISYGQGLIPSAVAIAKITVIWASVLYVLWLACSVLQKKKRAWKEGKYTDVNS